MSKSNQKKIAKFIQQLNQHHLPVLNATLLKIGEKLALKNFKYEQLGNLFHQDPACLFNFLACADQYAQQHSADFEEKIKTPLHAAMLLGVDNIKNCISKLTSLKQIKDRAIAQKLEQLACRSLHCAYQAQHLARLMKSKKEDDEEIFLTALMMSLAELLVWFISPRQAQKYELLVYNSEVIISKEEAQLQVFDFIFTDLILNISVQWNLPELYIKTLQTDVFDEAKKSIICIKLADKLSRLVDFGWYYQELYDHLDYCALVTPFSSQRLTKEFHQVAVLMTNTMSGLYKLSLPTSSLVLSLGKIPYYQVLSIEDKTKPLNNNKITSKTKAITTTIKAVSKLETASNLPLLIQLTINTLFESNHFDQVILLMLDKSKMDVTVRLEKTSLETTTLHKKISILPNKNLFTLLIQKHQPIFVKASEAEKYTHLLGPSIFSILASKEFFAKGFYYRNKPIGIFYASHSNGLDDKSYDFFKKVLLRFEKHLNKLS